MFTPKESKFNFKHKMPHLKAKDGHFSPLKKSIYLETLDVVDNLS